MNEQEIQSLMASISADRGMEAELIQTHISWVILVGDRVWKIKKPMHYPFLDFSSQEARARYCRRELELNRRQAPEMYLDVVPVCLDGETWSIGHDCRGAVVDHAVLMKRMKEELRLDRLLDGGKIDPKEGASLAKKVVEFHRKAPVMVDPLRSDSGVYKEDFADILSVRAEFRKHLGEAAEAQLVTLTEESLAWLDGAGELLRDRLESGWVRDLHGDLHTRNVFVQDGFVVFDCIEFSDPFRQIDVLSEIAFLYMDVEVRGCQAFGDAFLGSYLQGLPAIRHRADLELFNYFRRYRANVRAKVNALRAMQARGDDLQQAVEEMRLYLDLMAQTAIEGTDIAVLREFAG